MPRKTKEATEITRRRILDVALEVFAERGYSRTSLQQIAERAGFTRGAVYWHFKNKADLFMALSEDVEGSTDDAFEDVAHINSRQDLSRFLAAELAHFETDERLGTFYKVANFRTEWAEELQPLLEGYRQTLRELAVWMIEAVDRLARLGEVRASCDPQRDGFALYVQFVGLVTVWVTDPAALSLTRDAPGQIERAVEALLG